MRTLDRLAKTLHRIDGRGYKAYQEIKGAWQADTFILEIAHVQGDPFATPSRVHVRIPTEVHRIPLSCWNTGVRSKGLRDYLLRVFRKKVSGWPRVAGSGHSGEVRVPAGQAEILERAGCAITPDFLEIRFRVGLPAQGRRILGKAAARLLTEWLPQSVPALYWENLNHAEVIRWVNLTDDHDYLQRQLSAHKLVAFVANGSILPRESGVSYRPLANAVPFESPPELQVALSTQHHGVLVGMGIPEGVTLITGGGFHGKTTLLEAIQTGIYPHVPGDGREWVVTHPAAVKVISEDGRSISGVDISSFLTNLPLGIDTRRFSTQDASGSTSLAASIMEALEVGARVLLIDEDRAATNFLIRDARMQRLIKRETIIPYIDRVRELFEQQGVSTLLVIGGSGDYLDVADTVLLMENYRAQDATKSAREIARAFPTARYAEGGNVPLTVTPRQLLPQTFEKVSGRRMKIQPRGVRELILGQQVIDISGLEQLTEVHLVSGIGTLLVQLPRQVALPAVMLSALRELFQVVSHQGLYALNPLPEQALPRIFEVAGALNRVRTLQVQQVAG